MQIKTAIKDVDLVFETTSRVFSPNAIDKGTLAMLSRVDFMPGDRVLDLGCGYGVVGILAAKILGEEHVVMVDNDRESVSLSRKNARLNQVPGITILERDGFHDMNETDFSLILSNPPYHTDFSVAKMFIEKGFNRLRIGGKMFMVTKRKLWYQNKLTAIFGGAMIWEMDDYFIFMSMKKDRHYASYKKKKS